MKWKQMKSKLSGDKGYYFALAVCTDALKGQDFGTPCGACRQVMTEFMDQDAAIILVAHTPKGALKTSKKKLADFMPYPFPKISVYGRPQERPVGFYRRLSRQKRRP